MNVFCFYWYRRKFLEMHNLKNCATQNSMCFFTWEVFLYHHLLFLTYYRTVGNHVFEKIVGIIYQKIFSYGSADKKQRILFSLSVSCFPWTAYCQFILPKALYWLCFCFNRNDYWNSSYVFEWYQSFSWRSL